jgi:5-methylcytosine-specific restriction endonuclease McrA
MNKDVLVLNKCFIPLHIISWKRAMTLLIQDKCKVTDEDYIQYTCDLWIDQTKMLEESDDFHFIHTPRYRIALPHVIVLTAFDKLPKNQVKYSRESLFQRDKNSCAYCGNVFKRDQLTIDHINPKSAGGIKSWKNTITACKACNSKKADRTPDEAYMPLKFQPKEPSWFQQIKSLTEKIGLKRQWLPYIDSFILKGEK